MRLVIHSRNRQTCSLQIFLSVPSYFPLCILLLLISFGPMDDTFSFFQHKLMDDTSEDSDSYGLPKPKLLAYNSSIRPTTDDIHLLEERYR